MDAARTLFLRDGYAGTTMDEIAAAAGLTKRTVYNNYADKEALFTEIVADVSGYVEGFARELREEFTIGVTTGNLRSTLHDLARRLALAILRTEVIGLRRLLVGEARSFPALAAEYYERAPGQVIEALAAGFEHLTRAGLLRIAHPSRAAAQFAYLVVGEHLDRAMLTGAIPSKRDVVACVREGVETFLTRYGVPDTGRRKGR